MCEEKGFFSPLYKITKLSTFFFTCLWFVMDFLFPASMAHGRTHPQPQSFHIPTLHAFNSISPHTLLYSYQGYGVGSQSRRVEKQKESSLRHKRRLHSPDSYCNIDYFTATEFTALPLSCLLPKKHSHFRWRSIDDFSMIPCNREYGGCSPFEFPCLSFAPLLGYFPSDPQSDFQQQLTEIHPLITTWEFLSH